MRVVGSIPIFVFIAVLLAPTGQAATGTLEATVALPIMTDGATEISTLDGTLHIEGPGAAPTTINNAWGTATLVTLRTFGYVVPTDPSAKFSWWERAETTTIPLDGDTITWAGHFDGREVLIRNAALAWDSEAAIIGALSKPEHVSSHIEHQFEVRNFGDDLPDFHYTIPAGQFMTRGGPGTISSEGAMDAYLYGTTIKFHGDETPGDPILANTRTETRPGALYDPVEDEWFGAGTHEELIQQYLTIRLNAGNLETRVAGANAFLYTREPVAEVVGTANMETVNGHLVMDKDGEQIFHEFSRSDVELQGAFTLAPHSLSAANTRSGVDGEGDWTYVAYDAVQAEYDWTAVATALGVGAVLLAAAAWVATQGKALLAGAGGIWMAGYARVQGDAVLEHDGRRNVYEAIQENPGLSITKLAEVAGCSGSTLNYHLRVLEKNELVITQRDGRYLRYFDRRSGLYANGRKKVVAALRNDTSAAIAGAILHNPGVAQCDLAEAFEVAPSTVNWHIRRLAEAGLVEKTRDRHFTRYFAGESWAKVPEEEAARFGIVTA